MGARNARAHRSAKVGAGEGEEEEQEKEDDDQDVPIRHLEESGKSWNLSGTGGGMVNRERRLYVRHDQCPRASGRRVFRRPLRRLLWWW